MKKWPLALLIACVLVGAVWLLRRSSETPVAPGASQESQIATPGQRAAAKSPNQILGATPGQPGSTASESSTNFPAAAPIVLPPTTPFVLGSADKPPPMDPATVLGNMRIAIKQYGSRFGGNPVGTNEEITRALNGENPKQVKFISEDSGLRINGRGELVDYWGTPFFFHQLSGTEMEIHSAGPDKIMWTADDLVTK